MLPQKKKKQLWEHSAKGIVHSIHIRGLPTLTLFESQSKVEEDWGVLADAGFCPVPSPQAPCLGKGSICRSSVYILRTREFLERK